MGESRQRSGCVFSLPAKKKGRDTRSLCVVCLRVKRAESALEGVDGCDASILLHSQKALFEEGAFTGVSRSASPAFAEAERWLRSRVSLSDPLEGM